MVPTNRREMAEAIRRGLGEPVIALNIAPEQIEDVIDITLDFWRTYHYDGQEKLYIAHQLTQAEVDQKYVEMGTNISAVTSVWKVTGDNNRSAADIWNVTYQMRLSLWDLSTSNLSGYVIAKQYLEQISDILQPDCMIRFREYDGKLHLDDTKSIFVPDMFIIIECYAYLGNDTRIWENRVLRQLAVAYARRQWALNMLKFKDAPLTGGLTLNASELLEESNAEIAKVEADFIKKYQDIDECYVF